MSFVVIPFFGRTATLSTITLGKWRRLQRTASPRGTFTGLAMDHRGPIRRALEADAGAAVPDETLSALKGDVVRAIGGASSAVLLDPETGVGPCVTDGALDGQTGLIVALDTGSTGDPHVRLLEYAQEWQADILVMGSTNRGRLARLILGDTLLHTIRQAEIPLFLAQ